MDFRQTKIPDCQLISAALHEDLRGSFIKVFQASVFQTRSLDFHPKEVFISHSNKNVLRGMHFQAPPHDHDKFVFILSGAAFDAVLDLRKGSPTYLQTETFELTPNHHQAIFIPKGVAHGFCALSDRTIILYATDSEHHPESDQGILWSSAPIEWPVEHPVLSQRDQNLTDLDHFDSPFRYDG